MTRPGWATPHGLALAAAALALAAGAVAWLAGMPILASHAWSAGVVPALLLLIVELARQLARLEPGVDIIAGLAMGGALLLGESLAGVVIALMFTGGNVLEEFAPRRANRELTALLAAPRAWRTARAARISRTCRWRSVRPATGWWSRAARSCRSTARCWTRRR